MQLNIILFAKTLIRKNISSSLVGVDEAGDKIDFASKAEVMTLMTTDASRVGELSRHSFTLTGLHHAMLALNPP